MNLLCGQTGGRLRSRSLPCLYRIIAWTFLTLAAGKFFHRPGITAYIQAFQKLVARTVLCLCGLLCKFCLSYRPRRLALRFFLKLGF